MNDWAGWADEFGPFLVAAMEDPAFAAAFAAAERELPPAGPAPIPAEMVVSIDQAEGRACIVCAAPAYRGMNVNVFMSGGKELWACPGPCSDTMFERLGFR